MGNNKYVDRLYNEWKQHGKIILSIDFDSTISPYHTIDNEEDVKACIELIKECQSVGCYSFIHTACNPNRYEYIMDYCKKAGIDIDTINKTPIETPYGQPGSKPYYNHSLDDRSGLRESMEILKEAMYLMRAYKAGKRLDYDGSSGF